ncbi:MAG: hypothetical protein ACYSR0_12805 [Planctomycetota bacterium]|jgi:hypothetical protein
MPEVKSRENNPLPGIEYSEIHIPDEDSLGTGTFVTVLEPGAMAKINPIMSTIVNKPVFQLIVSVNAGEEEATVALGKADNKPALSRKVFSIPKDTRSDESHELKVVFSDWDIKALQMNGDELKIVK